MHFDNRWQSCRGKHILHLKNKKMVFFNDGQSKVVWTDGQKISFKTKTALKLLPFESGSEQGVSLGGSPYVVLDITEEQLREFIAHQENIRQGRELPERFGFDYIDYVRHCREA